MRKVVDAMVIGAGPGGAASACHLAEAGLQVLLVDRAESPRDKVCGDGLNSRALNLLSEIRITFQDLMERGGAQIIGYRQFSGALGVKQLHMESTDPKPGFGLPRLELDELIRQRCLAAGAQWLSRVQAKLAIHHPRQGTFVVHTDDGRAFLSRSLIVAIGAHSLFHNTFLTQGSSRRSAAVGMRSYFRAPHHQFRTFDFFRLSYLREGYGWIFPVSDTLCNVGIWVPRARSRSLKAWYGRFVSEVVMPSLPADSKMITQPRGGKIGVQPGISSQNPLALLVGDAAHLADPLSGEGISHALYSAKVGASRLISILSERSLPKMSAFDRSIDDLRDQIDQIDRTLLDLLNSRAKIVISIQNMKRQRGLPPVSTVRENEIVRRLRGANAGPMPDEAVEDIFRRILHHSTTSLIQTSAPDR